MDEYVKRSIETRKNVFAMTYDLNAEAQQKIDALFAEIEALGAKCNGVAEFEAEFAASPLNQKYMELLTEISQIAPMKAEMDQTSQNEVGKTMVKNIVGGVAESALSEAAKSVLPTKASVNQKIYDEARDVPVLGEAIDVAQKASFAAHLGKLFKKK